MTHTVYRIHDFQMHDSLTNLPIITAGGQAIVCLAGNQAKASLFDPDANFATLANPIAAVRGKFRFAIDNALGNEVDVYGFAPGGQAFQVINRKGQSENEYYIDTNRAMHTLIVPYSFTDMTAAVVFDTGLDIPQDWLFYPYGNGVDVIAIDATETLDVGFLNAGESGDENGLITLIDVGTLGVVAAEGIMTAGGSETYHSSTTLGVLLATFLAGADVATDTGSWGPKHYRTDGTIKSLTMTNTAGFDTGEGYVFLNYTLPRLGA